MKFLATLILMFLFAVTVSACAHLGKQEQPRVQCPACGFEFEAPLAGG